MSANPLPILIILLYIKSKNNSSYPIINTLEIESTLDNAINLLHTIDKLNNLSEEIPTSLPNMENLLKLAGPLLTSSNTSKKENS